MSTPTLLVRADASVSTGTGHVMRCLALAQAWQDAGGRAVFATVQATPRLRERFTKESCEVVDLSAIPGTPADALQTIAAARNSRAEWIIVDGYQFSAEYQTELKGLGGKVLFVDDYAHAQCYAADVVLNQNVFADESMYKARRAQTRLLLGPKYCLLRREFAPWQGWKRQIAAVGRRILVTFGGSDPGNVTRTVANGLRDIPDIEARVIVGAGNPHVEDMQLATENCKKWLKVETDISNMPEQMAWADIMIAGAGSTCWEACLLRLPMLLIDVAVNQTPIARGLAKEGAAIHLGAIGEVTTTDISRRIPPVLKSERQRTELSGNCGRLVDGRGASRVCQELRRVG